MKRVNVLVEGYTEERFIKQIFQPHFWDLNTHIEPILLETKRVISGGKFSGGVSSFSQFERSAQRLIGNPGGALMTTMLDYYRLPSDFPGMHDRPSGTPQARIMHVESALLKHFHSPVHFLPYLSLHEFEALLFAAPDELARALTLKQKESQALASIRASVESPEDINERPDQSPSKRIESLAPGYRKTLYGPIVCGRVGLETLRQACPHFDAWVSRLEIFAYNK